jgi:hypothetical protein
MLERYARLLESGLLSVAEVSSAVLSMLADALDPAGMWAGVPAALRRPVLAYLAEVGAANISPAFWIGPGEPDPTKRATHTARRRAIAAELLADAEPP